MARIAACTCTCISGGARPTVRCRLPPSPDAHAAPARPPRPPLLAPGLSQMLASLSSPFIVKYLDSYLHDGSLYIVMEYAQGGRCALRSAPPLPRAPPRSGALNRPPARPPARPAACTMPSARHGALWPRTSSGACCCTPPWRCTTCTAGAVVAGSDGLQGAVQGSQQCRCYNRTQLQTLHRATAGACFTATSSP